MNPAQKLKEIGLEWPDFPHPPSYYYQQLYDDNSLATRQAEGLLFLTALPVTGGESYKLGRLGAELGLEEGYECARRAAVAALSEIEHALGNLDHVDYITQLTGFIATAPGFTDQPRVLNGASDVFAAIWGESGESTRAAIGCACLPGNNAVELALIVKLKS